jgi:monoamine oxidase
MEKKFPGNRFKELRKSATRFAEGFDLADPQTASTRVLANEWSQMDSKQFRIPGGYDKLIHAMTEEFYSLGGEILFGHIVDSVVWYPGDIRIGIRDNHSFKLDKLIISLPLSMLNQSAPLIEQISFFPYLDEQQKEFTRIGFGTVVKTILIWDSPFWNQMIPEAQFIFSDCFIPTWWTTYPQESPLLTGWLGGPSAELVSDETDEFFLDKSLQSLSHIFSVSETELKKKLRDFRIFNWKNEPWIRGAYSYARVESQAAKTLCRESLEGRVYFSGEAYYEGSLPGTVEAAVTSGQDTARLLLEEIK